ncbi:MAG: RuvX/YqgF family protein [Planctomycetes bacterium]|nr:RuvX/YqgF family protein [Planctomycetota bacterium]
MGRWLGTDHGSRRIGLAVGGQEDGIATPLEVLSAQPARKAVERIVALAKDYGVRPADPEKKRNIQDAVAKMLHDFLQTMGLAFPNEAIPGGAAHLY